VALYTIGHSSRTIDEFVAICRAHGLLRIIDVRRFPGSRRHPHFGREPLAATLSACEIAYEWLPSLGGRRRRAKDAPPSAWREPSFAAYADYMNTADFIEAIAHVLREAAGEPTAVMCAEAFPYSCHRRLISDWVELHGMAVEHILDETRRERHRVTEFARVDADGVRYDVGTQMALPLG
jgi:uncharacterized protein (DUF488 family)